MLRVLFIGNFLSKTKGTLNPSEKIAGELHGATFSVIKGSTFQNILFRFIDILYKSMCKRYDVIHIDVFSGKAMWFAVCAATIGSIRNKKVILNLHGGKLPEVYEWKKTIIEKLLKKAAKIVTPSLYLRDFFLAQGFKVGYLPNPVDLKIFSSGWGADKLSKKSILWIRSFSEIYRPLLAIQILEQVTKQFPDAMLTMIGPAGNQSEAVKEYIVKAGLSNVHVHEPIPNKELPAVFKAHSIFLNTTQYESFGMGVFEAMACGIPVVTASVGEIPYLWEDRKHAALVKGNDPNVFAERIVELLRNPKESVEIAKAAREKVETFCWESVRNRWEILLQE